MKKTILLLGLTLSLNLLAAEITVFVRSTNFNPWEIEPAGLRDSMLKIAADKCAFLNAGTEARLIDMDERMDRKEPGKAYFYGIYACEGQGSLTKMMGLNNFSNVFLQTVESNIYGWDAAYAEGRPEEMKAIGIKALYNQASNKCAPKKTTLASEITFYAFGPEIMRYRNVTLGYFKCEDNK
jgi:hypothetical protein